MCRASVTWYACGCEDKVVKLETCDYRAALNALIEQGAQFEDSRVVENREHCFEVMDQGRKVVMEKRKCDNCQHIYTEETYGTERQRASLERDVVVENSTSMTIGKSHNQP